MGTSVQSYPSSTFVTASFISVLSASPGATDVPINDVLSPPIAATAAAATLAAVLAQIVTTGRGVASGQGLALRMCCCVDSMADLTLAALKCGSSLFQKKGLCPEVRIVIKYKHGKVQ